MISNIDKTINSAGLICDLIGAWFVAWEVVKQFQGSKIDSDVPQCGGIAASESNDYIQWEKKKYFRMKIGLAFLTLGFSLQIFSNWIIVILNKF